VQCDSTRGRSGNSTNDVVLLRDAAQHGSEAEGVVRTRRLVALCESIVLAGWFACALAGLFLSSSGRQNTGASEDDMAGVDLQQVPRTVLRGYDLTVPHGLVLDGALSAPATVMAPETPPEQLAVSSSSAPHPNEAARSVESVDDCPSAENCIDQYLWSVYQRTRKVDTVKVSDRIKVTVTSKGRTRTVTKTVTKLVVEDFTWKDPKAAEKAGISLKEYVIGGMDRTFKLKLHDALRAMDAAGLAPGITSGFRDDYRQSLVSGLKAAVDSSYHGGSRRGGYGHGLAADLVSVKDATSSDRSAGSEQLWKWIDEHGEEFGIGRPYLDRDPPHVGPIDGQEYAEHRGGARPALAGLKTNGPHRVAAHMLRSEGKRTEQEKAFDRRLNICRGC
jgi:hypothetical protein